MKRFLTLMLLSALLIFSAQMVYAEGGPVITAQPENVDVEYPDRAMFKVEVEDPDSVASYQWELTDGYSTFILQGESAKTDTLVIPATEENVNPLKVRCTVTDKDGNSTVSDYGMLTVTNCDDRPISRSF